MWEDLSLTEVADRGLEVAVFHHDRLGQHELLGGVRLNLGTGRAGALLHRVQLYFSRSRCFLAVEALSASGTAGFTSQQLINEFIRAAYLHVNIKTQFFSLFFL